MDECKPLPCGLSDATNRTDETGQGLTFVHIRAQLEQLQDTFMS